MTQTLLKDIATIISGHPFRSKIQAQAGGNTRVIQMKDLLHQGTTPQPQGIDWGQVVSTTVSNIKPDRHVLPGDILFVARGNRNSATLVHRLPEHVPANASLLCSPHFFMIRLKVNSGIDPAFLAWYLNQQPAQQFFERHAQGTNIQSVSREVLQSVVIPRLPATTQAQIIQRTQQLYQHQQLLMQLIHNDQQMMDGMAQALIARERG